MKGGGRKCGDKTGRRTLLTYDSLRRRRWGRLGPLLLLLLLSVDPSAAAAPYAPGREPHDPDPRRAVAAVGQLVVVLVHLDLLREVDAAGSVDQGVGDEGGVEGDGRAS